MEGSVRSIWLTAAFAASFTVCIFVGSAGAQQAGPDFGVRFLPPVEDVPAGPMVPPVGSCRTLTLEQARQQALANNKSLILAHLNVDEKAYVTSAATKDYFPKLMGSESYFHFDSDLGKVLTTRGVILPTTVPVNVLNQDSALTTVLVAQPITKLIAVNALVQIDRADENIAKAQLDKGAKEVLSGVTQVYYGLVGARRIESALQLQATMLEQLLAAKPSPEMRIGLLEVRQGLVQVQQQEHDLEDQLNDLLSFPPGTRVELDDPIPAAPPVQSAEQAGIMALACNPEVREAEQSIAKAEAALRVAKMAYLPDVNIVGGYANQSIADYIQPNFSYLGITANYTFFEWGQKCDVVRQRQTDIALAHQNVQVVRDKVQLAARKSYDNFDQAQQSYRLAGEMVQAYQDAEKGATTPAAMMTAKAAASKAQLEAMKAEITYRVAYAQLMGAIGNE